MNGKDRLLQLGGGITVGDKISRSGVGGGGRQTHVCVLKNHSIPRIRSYTARPRPSPPAAFTRLLALSIGQHRMTFAVNRTNSVEIKIKIETQELFSYERKETKEKKRATYEFQAPQKYHF